jgi:hypothetical protein
MFRGYRARIVTFTYQGTYAASQSELAVTAANCKLTAITGMDLMSITDGGATIIGATWDGEHTALMPIMADGQWPTNDSLADCAVKMLVIGT